MAILLGHFKVRLFEVIWMRGTTLPRIIKEIIKEQIGSAMYKL